MYKWLKTWLNNTVRSAHDPTFYKEMVKKKYPNAVWHLYGALFLVSLAWSAMIAVGILSAVPAMRVAIASIEEVIPTLYPEELIVTIKDGELSTNVKEPYSIEAPEEWRALFVTDTEGRIRNLVTIDTRGSAEAYASYNSAILVTKHSIVAPDDNNGLKIYSLKDVKELTIDKAFYDGIVVSAMPIVRWIPALALMGVALFILVLPFIIAGFGLLAFLAYLFILVLMLWVIAMIMNVQRPYWDLYWLSCYGLTVPLIYRLLEIVSGKNFTWVFSIIFFGWMAYVLKRIAGHAKKS